jgi:hypothetical protein
MQRRGELRSPGTTLSLVLIEADRWHAGNAGDGGVFLLRHGSALRLLGEPPGPGAGRAPVMHLGLDGMQPEMLSGRLEPGDRLLLCTDGLIRATGGGALPAPQMDLNGAPDAVERLAEQMLAAAPIDDFDDDATVALAEIRPAPDAPPHASGTIRGDAPAPPAFPAGPSPRTPGLAAWAALVTVLAVGAVGFALGRATAPRAAVPEPPPPRPSGPERPPAAIPVPGSLVLVDPVGQGLYVVAEGDRPAPSRPVELQGYAVGADGRLQDRGRYTLDPARGELLLPGGRRLRVSAGDGGGWLGGRRAARLVVEVMPPGTQVVVDGKNLGRTPVTLELPPGRRAIRLLPSDGDRASRPISLELQLRPGQELRLRGADEAR